jgi:hypothetical protein
MQQLSGLQFLDDPVFWGVWVAFTLALLMEAS